jgi:hypothetical protein
MTPSSTKNLQVQARGFSVFSNRAPVGLMDDGTQVVGTSEASPTVGGSSGRSCAVVPIVCGVICRRRSGRPLQFSIPAMALLISLLSRRRKAADRDTQGRWCNSAHNGFGLRSATPSLP